ncbi:MAG: HAD-IB family hydrolase [Alphaproteobacteria bacterium]|nr:HAD-IB family hydrolase [Alphaproteobacteria bacterium]
MAGTAIFDLDLTLTRRGTWSRFVLRLNARRPLFWLQLPVMGVLALAYKLGIGSRRAVKEYGLSTLKWASRETLETAAEAFARDEVPDGLRTQVMQVLEALREDGTDLVLATASAELTAIPIARALGMTRVVATRLEWDANGHLTGRLLGENCYDTEKLKRLEVEDAREPFARPVSFYSDHVSDLPVMLWADQAIAVNPLAPMRRAALEHAISIVDWDAPPATMVE